MDNYQLTEQIGGNEEELKVGTVGYLIEELKKLPSDMTVLYPIYDNDEVDYLEAAYLEIINIPNYEAMCEHNIASDDNYVLIKSYSY